ncbi:hypothetical protein BJX96DRAFT_164782 [Aspergillus floccosus]
MDRTPTSFPSSPSGRSVSISHTTMDATYASPARGIPQYMTDPTSTIGLGISNCDIGSLTSPSSPLASESYPSPAPDWSEHLYPSQRLLDPTLNVGQFPTTTTYDISAPSFATYHAQPATMPHSYGGPLNSGTSNDMMYYPQPSMWTNIPHLDAPMYPDTQYGVKEEQEESWAPPFATASTVMEAGIATQTSHDTIRNSPSKYPQALPNTGRLAETDTNVDGSLQQPQTGQSAEVFIKWTKENNKISNDRRRKVPSASGLQCPICGRVFTRRSNCHEHVKRHDPSRKKLHPCDCCGKSFGRNGDLRRHKDTVRSRWASHGRVAGC